MKFISILPLLISAYLLQVQSVKIDKLSGEESQAAEADLDALMDKYDDKEQSDKKPKGQKGQGKSNDPNQPNASMIQDFELKILSGNNLADASEKTAQDDAINEVLDKYSKKNKNGDKIIQKDDA